MSKHGSKVHSQALQAALRVEVKMQLPDFDFNNEDVIVHHYKDTKDFLQLEYEVVNLVTKEVRFGRLVVTNEMPDR